MPNPRPHYRHACLFLGHNASTVLWNDASDMFAIEDEKESRAKGGEYVPLHTLMQLSRYEIDQINVINFLGEINYGELVKALYGSDQQVFETFCDHTQAYELKVNHHATHAMNGVIEAWGYEQKAAKPQVRHYHVLITDGTGNDYEATSLYNVTINRHQPLQNSLDTLARIRRISAADLSCGIMFARLVCNADTGFAPLKDEYKSLGYETDIGQLMVEEKRQKLDRVIDQLATRFLHGLRGGLVQAIRRDITELLLGMGELHSDSQPPAAVSQQLVELSWQSGKQPLSILGIRHRPSLILRESSRHQHLQHGMSVRYMQNMASWYVPMLTYLRHWVSNYSRYQIRVLLSYVANRFLEYYLTGLLKQYQVENLIVGGGVHFNVKFNNIMLKSIPGKLCCSPLAGDIVHALTGAVLLDHGLAKRSCNLLLLKRHLQPAYRGNFPQQVMHIDDPDIFVEEASQHISEGRLVNVVKGWGELGPRALLSNSTLCLPTAENKNCINQLNGRDDHMPMAPVLIQENLIKLFEEGETSRLIGSVYGMIIALNYKSDVPREKYSGVMHTMNDGSVTGRPMVASDILDRRLLRRVEEITGYAALINTSFNMHGRATVQRIRHAYNDFDYQCHNAKHLGIEKPLLIVGTWENI